MLRITSQRLEAVNHWLQVGCYLAEHSSAAGRSVFVDLIDLGATIRAIASPIHQKQPH